MFTANEGAVITPQQAATLSASYTSTYPGNPTHFDYASSHIESIVAQSGSVCLTTFYGLKAGKFTQILVGTDAGENNLVDGYLFSEGSAISLDAASGYTAAFRSAYSSLKKSISIGNNHVLEMLEQDGATGLRVYFGVNSEGDNTVWLQAVNGDAPFGVMYNWGSFCPPQCGTSNSLNS